MRNTLKKALVLLSTFSCCHSISTFALSKDQIIHNLDKSLLAEPKKDNDQTKDNSQLFSAINSSVTTPNAEGSTERAFFVGLAYIKNWEQDYEDSPAILFGSSFGNAQKNLGITVALSSPLTDKGNFHFQSHGLSLRLNRYITKSFSAAIGANNLIGTGSFKTLAHSFYAVVTANMDASILPIKASIGLGSGSFNSAKNGSDNIDKYFSAFYNIGFGLTKNWSFMADWNAQSLALGSTYILNVTKKIPLAITIGVLNVAGTLPEGVKRNNVVVSVAYGAAY